MPPLDPITLNVQGPKQLVASGVNKVNSAMGFDGEGVTGDYEDEFTLKLDDEELLKLSSKWTDAYRGYEAKIKKRQEANKSFYLGTQDQGTSALSTDSPNISANLLFEAEETFLPAALSKNPEPVVWCDNTPEGTELANEVKTMLQYHADTLVLRAKLERMTRHWSIYFIGALKHGWDKEVSDIKLDVIEPQRFIFDPEASIDVYGSYDGAYLGERKECTAEHLIDLFPKHRAYIVIMTDGFLGTKVEYTEWRSDEYCFYTFKGKVLDKHKNEHFNYGGEQSEMDQDGQMQTVKVGGRNHFARPRMPYTFLSVFSLGEQPHDMTTLIEQNIPNQRRITRRTNQLDYNLSRANNSDVFSEDNFNQETAKQAAGAFAKGNPVLVPTGKPIAEAIHRLQAPAVGAEFFRELEISKQDLRQIFGTEGISSQKPDENTTARGMILQQQFDNSRIGGGIGDAIAQVADNVFNWWVQLYYVYYDQPHFAAIMGGMKAVEYVTLQSQDLTRKLVISVAADSMKPKDEITQMNQAMTLWDKGALDPKTLLTMLNFPDPSGTAENVILWLLDKNAYMQLNFPEVAQKIQEVNAKMQAQALAGAGGAPPGATPTPGPPAPNSPQAIPSPLSVSPASAALSNVPLQK